MLRAEFYDVAKQTLTDIALRATQAREIVSTARDNTPIDLMSKAINEDEENFLIRLKMFLDGLENEIKLTGGR